MFGQSLDAVALGGVVAAGQVGHAGFPGQVHHGLRHFAGDKGIHPQGDGLFKIALGATAAPGQSGDRLLGLANDQRHPLETRMDIGFQACHRSRFKRAAEPADVLLAKTALGLPAQTEGQLGVIAQTGVGIQGQVVGKKIDVGLEQGPQASLADTGDAAILAPPEIAVVHQDGIGFSSNGGIYQGLAGRHPGDNSAYLGLAFHLQAVWAIIPEPRRLQELVQIARQFISLHRSYQFRPQ